MTTIPFSEGDLVRTRKVFAQYNKIWEEGSRAIVVDMDSPQHAVKIKMKGDSKKEFWVWASDVEKVPDHVILWEKRLSS